MEEEAEEFPAYPEINDDYCSEVLWYARHIWVHGFRVKPLALFDDDGIKQISKLHWKASVNAVAREVTIYGSEVSPRNDHQAMVRYLWSALLAWVEVTLATPWPHHQAAKDFLEKAASGREEGRKISQARQRKEY